MALRVKKIGELDELNTYLRGGIIGGRDLRRGVFGNIDGKTLVFTTPAGTVTFATTPPSTQVGLTIKDILAQINAVHPGFAHVDGAGRLVIEDPAGAVAVVLGAASTADVLFGFGQNGQTGTVYSAPGGGVPELVSVSLDPLGGGTYLLTTDE